MSARGTLRRAGRVMRESFLDICSMDFGKAAHALTSLGSGAIQGGPHTVTIEPVNTCNLSCEFCSTPPKKLNRAAHKMPPDNFKKIVDGLPGSVHYLWLFLAGEPLLNPALSEMISYASSKNLRTVISTNANLLDRETSRALINAGLDKLIVSLDSISKENYETMRRGGDFNTVMRNIRAFAEEKISAGRAKPEIELQMISTKVNAHEKKDFREFARSLGAAYAIKSLAIPEWAYSKRETARITDKYFAPETAETAPAQGCSFTRKGAILADGTVCACCYDFFAKHTFGNAIEMPFSEIWFGNEYNKARGAMDRRSFGICKGCADSRD